MEWQQRFLEERMKRGRWRTLNSVTRYEKVGRMLQKYSSYSMLQQMHGEKVQSLLLGIVLRGTAPIAAVR